MSKDKTKFSLNVNIKREDEKALVYYKQDGQRFEYNCTIKLNVETTYKFLLTFRPPLKVKSATLKGTLMELHEEERTSEFASYSFVWASHNACVSKKNHRDHFPLSLATKYATQQKVDQNWEPVVVAQGSRIDSLSLNTLDITFQFKFYKADDNNHCVWGNGLHHIEYDCIYKSDSDSYEMEKETVR
ncbi:CB1 cannabinoid receptor-interacting protein 1-like [Uloborus diversus]|uniref:CB1 cannabinoid receptor-interacting protein 1-like n=1 Tax=Uloborus diversus TaxID=327109 RepID=UPI002409B5B6|nr:CB1 cannabinoid receptor-interacting protein 1-like [Uloborus diversus]